MLVILAFREQAVLPEVRLKFDLKITKEHT
jgi:hypothetical protein